SLDVPHVVDEVRQDDGVERLGQLEVVSIGDHEAQLGVPPFGPRDHLLRKIEADANRRSERREEVPPSAPDLEDAGADRNEELIDVSETPLVVPAPPGPRVETARESIPMRLALAAIPPRGSVDGAIAGSAWRGRWRHDVGCRHAAPAGPAMISMRTSK